MTNRRELDRIPTLIARYKQAILAKALSGELTADWRNKKKNTKWTANTVANVSQIVFDVRSVPT